MVGTVVGVVAGFGLVILGAALEKPDELIGPGSSLSALGGLMLLGGLFMGWLAAIRRLFTGRGGLAREAAVAAGASLLPSLGLFLFAEGVRLPRSLAVTPGNLIEPELAALGTIVLVGWLGVFAWRVRRPRSDGGG